MSPTVTEVILHCQKQIKKDQSKEKLLHYIGRLSRLRIETDDLISTGIGRTVNQLSRMDGVVGEQAYNLVTHWKALVKAERSSGSSGESGSASSSEDEGPANHGKVPSVNEDSLSNSPPKIVINGHVGPEDEEDSSALPSFVNYSRNQDESDKESDSDHSDRLCIDDAPSIHSKRGTEVQESEEEEETEAELPMKFFPSSSSDESSTEESDVEEKKPQSKSSPKRDKKYAQHQTKTHSPSPTRKHEEKNHHRISEKNQRSSRDREKVSKTSDSKHHHRSDKMVMKVEPKSRSPSRSRSRSPFSQTHSKHHHSHHHKGDHRKVTIKKERMSKSRSPSHSRSPPSSSNRKTMTKNGLLAVPNVSIKKEKEDSPFRTVTSSPSKSKESTHDTTTRPLPKMKDEKSDRERSRGEKKDKFNSKDRKRRGDSPDEQEEKDMKKQKVDLPKTPEKKLTSLDCLKPKLLPRLNVEIDSTSGINFSDVLSGLDSKKLKKASKKTSPSKSSNSPSLSKLKQSESPSTSTTPPSRAVAKVSPYIHTPPPPSTSKVSSTEHLKILQELDAASREDRYWEDSNLALNGSYEQSDSDALTTMMSSRNQRTKVYSGVKSGVVGGKIPKLFDSCLRVVQENIFLMGYTGGVPYDILEPIIRRATLKELMHIEHYNPYLIEYTDSVWKYHCKQNFRERTPDEMETWRELYSRCVNEQSARFKSLTKKLKNKLEDATPLRKAKLAYVETHAGPKFSKSKAATIKTGMSSLKTREEKGAGRGHGSSASSGGGGNNNQQNVLIEHATVIIPAKSRRAGASSISSSSSFVRESSAMAKKPKKAPLMQKTLKSMKTLMRR